jgi:HAD superfamily hydrolase (TIGR01549 family)
MAEELQKSEGSNGSKNAALLFDLDGVLVDSRARNFVFYADVYSRAAELFGQPKLYSQTPEDIVNSFPLGLEDAVEALTPPGYKSLVPEIIEIARETPSYANLLSYPEGLDEYLIEFHRHYAQAVVTNAPWNSVDEIFNDHPQIEESIDFVVCGDDGWPQKPSPAPIHAALERLDVVQAVFIGDTAHTDGEAARAAGIPFIHIAKFKEPDPKADIVVADLYGLSLALSGLHKVVNR